MFNLSNHSTKSPSFTWGKKLLTLSLLGALSLPLHAKNPAVTLEKDSKVTIIGGGMASRMVKFSHFETELHSRYPDLNLVIRNMGDEGSTPVFRPHSGRDWEENFAVAGGEKLLRPELIQKSMTNPVGDFWAPDKWLSEFKTDVVIASYGFVSSFEGEKGKARYKKELEAFVKHTLAQKYNGTSVPQLVLVGPTSLEAKSSYDDVTERNKNLASYNAVMAEVATANKIPYIDLYSVSKKWYEAGKMTSDGYLLNDQGNQRLALELTNAIFGKSERKFSDHSKLHAAVKEKNALWYLWYKIPNGVHVYGRRHSPHGPKHYPDELTKLGQMTDIRDQAIFATLAGRSFDVKSADAKTHKIPDITTNLKGGKDRKYLNQKEALAGFNLPEGYKIESFADESEFKNLANPVQISFDNKGRLWVAVMPSYPHWKVGDPRPNDKLIILEDTDNDGKADKETVFADNLHLPIGFEFAPEGVYVSQQDSLVLLKDTDGDDKCDVREYVISGFDDHDTHHAIGAFCADPSGAFYLSEGVFSRTNLESARGPVHCVNGGFYRYDPARKHIERHSQLKIANPWGVATDSFGQSFYLFTSGPRSGWMTANSNKPTYSSAPRAHNLVDAHGVRPTSGLEIVSSRHFPDKVQGDILINNNIGFRGTKQHQVNEDGTGYAYKYRQSLLSSNDPHFRPVDLEFAPDGSLYVIDWSNKLIGHMQHSARDPLRDHSHGRVYRITYPSRPLVPIAKVAGASIEALLENLKLHEDRVRYRTRRELRGRDQAQVKKATLAWVKKLNTQGKSYEKYLLEALFVLWGINDMDEELLLKVFHAKDHRVRCMAIRAIRYRHDQISGYKKLLIQAASDPHGRVRIEALTTASWFDDKAFKTQVLNAIEAAPMDKWIAQPYSAEYFEVHQTKAKIKLPLEKESEFDKEKFNKKELGVLKRGKEIYHREAHCVTCHQEDGKGLPAANFPPLNQTKWVNENPDRLIKLTLKGMTGKIKVKGKTYNGAMTPFEGLLSDKEVADVLSYVRNSFGNKASFITPSQVKKVRQDIKDKPMYQADDLLKEHPHQK